MRKISVVRQLFASALDDVRTSRQGFRMLMVTRDYGSHPNLELLRGRVRCDRVMSSFSAAVDPHPNGEGGRNHPE